MTVDGGGFLEGTGSAGNITAVSGGTIVAGLIGGIGILYAAVAPRGSPSLF